MTLSEAIEIKEKYQNLLPKESHPELIIADNLSIEALKEIHRERIAEIPYIGEQLPGETKD